MRGKINSNSYAPRVIAAGLGLVAIGALLSCFPQRLPSILPAVFFALGAAVLAGFGLLLAVELIQDFIIARRYPNQRLCKLPLGNGDWECQACGSRSAGEKDTHCRACGIRFR